MFFDHGFDVGLNVFADVLVVNMCLCRGFVIGLNAKMHWPWF